MRALAVVTVLFLGFAAGPAVRAEDDPLAPVRAAAEWLARQAVADPPGGGALFPEYAESDEAPQDSLYAGGAGVLVFLENAAAVLDDEALAALADRTFASLLVRSEKAGDAGLYTGDAGIGSAFLVRHRLRKADVSALAAAKRIADSLLARQKPEGNWDESYDVIAGAAGTALFLLEAAKETGEEKYRAAAARAGRWLAARGTAAEDGTWWPSRAGWTRHYPNFSHGTAGIAYALARIAAETGDDACLAAAEAGAKLLLARGKRGDGTIAWCHYEPGHETTYMEGWCHGPSGTGRLFLFLASLTGKAEYAEAARAAAAWLRTARPEKETTRFYSPSLCCGVAGVLDFYADYARSTGSAEDRAYARFLGAALFRLSKPDGAGRKWTNYDHPDETGKIYHGTSLMLGAAGEAFALLRLAVLETADDPIASLPDRVVSAPGRYVVLTSVSDPESPYFRAATELAKFRRGRLFTDFDPERPQAQIPRLRELGARYVALVLPPEQIDTNTQRRFLMAACRIDDDIFPDVAWGYITGTAKTSPLEMVERAKKLESAGAARRWVSIGNGADVKSYATDGAGDPTAAVAGFSGRHLYVGLSTKDPDGLAFARRELAALAGGGFLTITGNADPEGIWLFPGARNADRTKHWPFDPARVGEDPEGEMPRILPADFGKADLSGMVVLAGTCHVGSLSRVFVEGDIVATFGRSEGYTEYRIPAGRSVGAAILDAGAAAFLAPCGPNHGYVTITEAQAGLERRLSLGDVLRDDACDIALAQGRAPEFDLHLPDRDRPDRGIGAIMQGGLANRVLYGDPALAPFRDVDVAPALRVATERAKDGGLRVVATLDRRDFFEWNLLSGDGNRDRIRAIVELPADAPAAPAVAARAFGPDGAEIAIGRLSFAEERIDGKRLLHLQVAAPGGLGLTKPGSRAEFRIDGR